MLNPSKEEVLAVSSVWVAFVLNLLPGLGTGYIYQRRWNAYWITGFVSLAWFLISLSFRVSVDPSDPLPPQGDQLGFYGLITVSIITAFESSIAVRRAKNKLFDSK